MDRHFTNYRNAGHVLSAVIPHTVINKHVTRHLDSKQWLRVVSQLRDGDPWASRAVLEAIDIRPVSQSRDPFAVARMASIADCLDVKSIADAAFAMCTISRLALFLGDASSTTAGYEAALSDAERELGAQPLSQTFRRSEFLKGAPLSEDTDSEGVAAAVVRAAVAWLRDAPSRRPIDLPTFNASTIPLQGVAGSLRSDTPAAHELLALLAPACHHVAFGAQHPDSLDDLLQLPHVIELEFKQNSKPDFEQFLSTHPTFPTLARQITRVQCDGGGLFLSPEGGPMFPSLTSVSLHGCSAEMRRWAVLANLPALTELTATEPSSLFDDDDAEEITNVPKREETIARALSAVGHRLRTLRFDSSWATFSLTEPRVLDAVWKRCGNLTTLSLVPISEAPADFFQCISSLRELRSLTLGELEMGDSSVDEKENVLRDLTALPAALSKLEVLTQSDWSLVLPCEFVEALAQSQTLTEWHVTSTEIASCPDARAAPHGTVPPFPKLRRATLRCESVAAFVSRGPSLAHVTLNESESNSVTLEALSPVRFPAGANVQVVVSLRLPLTVSACALHRSGATSLCGQLASDAVMETHLYASNVDDTLVHGGLPVTLRSLTIALSRPTTSAEVRGPPRGAKDLEELLRAARRTTPEGSVLEELTLIHPPDIDVARELCGGAFPQLRRITVTGAAGRWASSAQDLRSVCGDVVVDTATDPRAPRTHFLSTVTFE